MGFSTLGEILSYGDRPPDAATPVRISMPPEDGAEEVRLVVPGWQPPRGAKRQAVSGVTMVIDYVDSRGAASRRRITLREVEPGGDRLALLHAWCHERRAPRCFMLSRMRAVIDNDGLVHDPVAYLEGLLGGRVGGEAASDAGLRLRHLQAIEPVTVRVAVMMAQVDRQIRAEEIDAIVSWVASRADGSVTEADLAAFGRYLAALRLTADLMHADLEALERAPKAARAAALDLLYAVMEADGLEHPAEIALLDAIEEALDQDG